MRPNSFSLNRERYSGHGGEREDVRVGANRYIERQPIGTAAQNQDVDRGLLEPGELSSGWGRKNPAPSVPRLEFRALLVYYTAGISGTALLTKVVI